MKVVIYARFSSHSQTEQSIEGQLKICYEYAKAHDYTVIGEYIDRAQSAKTSDRIEFQKMIADSDNKTFQGVLVYQLDRFARNRIDSAIYKSRLKKNGIKVISAKENISEDASGILMEGVLESMAEYYSAELSQKIRRGMDINASKCLSTGSNPGLGYKVDKDRQFYVDEDEAKIVVEIFKRYARGETKKEIVEDLKRRQIKTSRGNYFAPNSLNHILRNKRYIGIYIYKDKEIKDGMPRIVDDDLFYRVQERLDKNMYTKSQTKAKEEYLLTTKLFCGHCNEMMTGYSGTSKTGRSYHYYTCKNTRKKLCDKKIIDKNYLEDLVVEYCLKLLDKESIKYLAKMIAEECKKTEESYIIKDLKKKLNETETAINNLFKALEYGTASELVLARLEERQKDKANLEKELAIEETKNIVLSEDEITAFLTYISTKPVTDIKQKKALINIFVHSVYLYDDHFDLILNGSDKRLNIDNIPITYIDAALENKEPVHGSSLKRIVPPDSYLCSRTDKVLEFFYFVVLKQGSLQRLLCLCVPGMALIQSEINQP